jgi:hypothetical protein
MKTLQKLGTPGVGRETATRSKDETDDEKRTVRRPRRDKGKKKFSTNDGDATIQQMRE